ncbi:hypothetical protein LguiA_017523 [Lonicera macranthoides]
MSAVLPWRTVASPPLRHYLLVSSSNGKPSSDGPAYAEIVVIRHGETEWNADGRVQLGVCRLLDFLKPMSLALAPGQLHFFSFFLQGHLDVELNDVGRQQAAAVTKDQDLRERHLGDLQGLVYSDAIKIYPEAHLALVSSRADQEIPASILFNTSNDCFNYSGGGESRDQVYQRCTLSLQRIGSKHIGERVVVVTHGGVIRSLHKRATPRGRSAGKILNTSVNVFHLSDGDEWTIEAWGDVSHLDQMGFLKSGFGGDATSDPDPYPSTASPKKRSTHLAHLRSPLHKIVDLVVRVVVPDYSLDTKIFSRVQNLTNLPSMASSDSSNGKCSFTDPAYAEIVVIRHGETEWNANGRIQGHVDIELNEVGRQQAAAVIKDPDLGERHLGDLQGLVYIEAVKIYPEIDVTFVSQTADREIPGGGETRDQVYQRCTSSLQRIGKKHKGERVVVVTHGGVIRALHKRATPQGQSAGELLNTSVNVFQLSDGDVWTIGSWDDVCHLN